MNTQLLSCLFALSIALVAIVVDVLDGDTVKVWVDDGHVEKVRIAHIDAPEKDQPYGDQARKALEKFTLYRVVEIDDSKRDKYGRILSDVSLAATDELVSVEMVRLGLAWVYKTERKHNSELMIREESARENKRGLWKDKAPIEPWVFRKKPKQSAAPT